MERYLQNIRSRPEHERRRFAYGVSFGITAILALVWAVTTLSSGLLSSNEPVVVNRTPAEVIRSQASDGFKAFLGATGAANLDVPVAATSGGIEVVSSQQQSATSSEQVIIPF